MELTQQDIMAVRTMWDGAQTAKAEHIVGICDMALAHLAAKERSVQGWALFGPSTMEAISLDRGYINERMTLFGKGYTFQPVTITINAAQEKRAYETVMVDGEPMETGNYIDVPAPAAPVNSSAGPFCSGQTTAAPVAESAEAAVDELMHGVYAYARIAHEFYKVADGDNSDERTRLRDAANVEATKLRIRLSAAFNEHKADGIRKGLEMANETCDEVYYNLKKEHRTEAADGALACRTEVRAALLDAQKEGV